MHPGDVCYIIASDGSGGTFGYQQMTDQPPASPVSGKPAVIYARDKLQPAQAPPERSCLAIQRFST